MLKLDYMIIAEKVIINKNYIQNIILIKREIRWMIN